MNLALHVPSMTRDEFLDWVQHQEGRHEFDGLRPVAMVGGTRDHSRIAANLIRALSNRLEGTTCEALGSGAGIATTGKAVRYPDVLVTCTAGPGADQLIPGVVVAFEVASSTSGYSDRIEKVREYHAVPSIRRYVIVEYVSAGLTVFERAEGATDWTAYTLMDLDNDMLPLPEIGIEVPLREIYTGTDVRAGAGAE